MLGSDKHHICLKGTNINDLHSSYHKRTCYDRGLLPGREKKLVQSVSHLVGLDKQSTMSLAF